MNTTYWDEPSGITHKKHEIVSQYLDPWLGILGHTNVLRIFLCDGFAGRGTHRTGHIGSPLLALESIVGLLAKYPGMSQVSFEFMFCDNNRLNITMLQDEVQTRYPNGLPSNLLVTYHDAEFEDFVINDLLPRLNGRHIPTLMLIDPFGFAGVKMRQLIRLAQNKKCELLISLMVGPLLQHYNNCSVSASVDEFFGIPQTVAKINSWQPSQKARKVVDLFVSQLKTECGFKHVNAFTMHNTAKNQISYALVHATHHSKGYSKIKQVLWKADPYAGNHFSTTFRNHNVGFELETDIIPLQDDLYERFQHRNELHISVIRKYVEFQTPYLDTTHCTAALRILEADGRIRKRFADKKKYYDFDFTPEAKVEQAIVIVRFHIHGAAQPQKRHHHKSATIHTAHRGRASTRHGHKSHLPRHQPQH